MAIEASLLRAGCQVTKLPDGNARADLIGEGMLESVSILVLSADDDAGNVDLALTVRRLRPDLPAVVRVFDEALAAYLRYTLDRLTILSMSGAFQTTPPGGHCDGPVLHHHDSPIDIPATTPQSLKAGLGSGL